jgi:hypothetical protein
MKRPPFTLTRSLLVLGILVGLLVVILGFDFGRKPRPNTNDDLTGLCISFAGASLVGLSTGLLLCRPNLAAALVLLSPIVYFALLVAVYWGWIIGRGIWLSLFG